MTVTAMARGRLTSTGRRREPARVAAGDEGDPVADQDEDADTDAEANEAPALRANGRIGQVSDLLGDGLPEELQLSGHARSDLAHHDETEQSATMAAAATVVQTMSRSMVKPRRAPHRGDCRS